MIENRFSIDGGDIFSSSLFPTDSNQFQYTHPGDSMFLQTWQNETLNQLLLLNCVLKFFPSAFRISYEKELFAYNQLLKESTEADFFARPLGYAEWSPSKYAKAIGRNIPSLLTGTKDKVIYVLMLGFVEGLQLEHVEPDLRSLRWRLWPVCAGYTTSAFMEIFQKAMY